jgi:hypothetical protein
VVGQAADQGVQHGRAVRVDDALAAAGGARRVAHGDGVVLVVSGVDERVGVRIREEAFVVEMPCRRIDRCARERHDDDFLEGVRCGELAVQRQQDVVDDQEAVVGIGGDPAELVGRQAQVERVHHAPGGGDAEVALEVGVMVPAQRRDAIARAQAETLQRRRQPAGAAVVLAVGVLAQRLVGQARDDHVVREDRPGALEEMVERQGNVHHGRLHRLSSVLPGVASVPSQVALAAAASRASTNARCSDASIDSTTSES